MHKIAEKKWSEKIFRAYDIRGKYPEEINEDAAYKIARAFVRYLKFGGADGKILKIVINSDSRQSSPSLKEAFLDGLMDENVQVIDAGIATTPMHYFVVNKIEADGGAMVTASHLPIEFNGIKLSKKGAMPIGESAGMDEIKNDAIRGIFTAASQSEATHKVDVRREEFLEEYKQFLIFHFPLLKSEIIKFTSGGEISGLAFDSDGDRVMFKDKMGNAISGDIITALLAKKYAKHGEKIVYDLRSSRVVKEIIEMSGAAAIESRVGHAFIKPIMRKENAVFGGELSGHYYFRDFFFCDSGIFAALAVLDLMRVQKKSLNELVKPFLKYSKTPELNFKVAYKEKVMDKVAAYFSDTKISYLDGIKIEFLDPHTKKFGVGASWWFNLRPSNTEDLVRLNLEVNTPELLEEKKKILEDLLGQ